MVVTCGDLVVSWWVLVLRVWQSIFAAPEGEASLIQAEPATANRLALCPNCLHGVFKKTSTNHLENRFHNRTPYISLSQWFCVYSISASSLDRLPSGSVSSFGIKSSPQAARMLSIDVERLTVCICPRESVYRMRSPLLLTRVSRLLHTSATRLCKSDIFCTRRRSTSRRFTIPPDFKISCILPLLTLALLADAWRLSDTRGGAISAFSSPTSRSVR